MKVHGIEGMSPDQIVFEIDRGGKFVFYRYCISVLILTFRRSSDRCRSAAFVSEIRFAFNRWKDATARSTASRTS